MTIIPNIMDQEDDVSAPRCMVFAKMETIIKDMQHSETGVPVRCQKNFLTTIPCAFTGYDLIVWLMEHLDIPDAAEAIHLGTLLCQYGYFFPVTEMKNLSVKDDGTLFRFQSPYFWPSQNWEPDNVDYALYLVKRSMRNKQRHGLEDYEQAAFNKLQQMLCDKWDFIFMHAEEQVRLAKDRKKADKVVLDSQEKAFWRVYRPPPGQMKCLEEGVRRNYKSNLIKSKKKTVDGYKKEIELHRVCLKQPRLKTSKAVGCLIQHSGLYEEHDPFLSPAQPSNPWISDDATIWMLNTALVGTPTERRVKRWSFSLQELLKDPTGQQEFELFLEKEYSSENLHFWMAVEKLKAYPLSKVEEEVEKIYKEYLAVGAPCEINIDSKTMTETLENLKNPDRFTFEAAKGHIFLLMKKDSYQRYLRSDQYKNALANAINPCTKKKFFTFGGKKKSPNPSPKPKRRGSASFHEPDGDRERLATNTMSQHSYSTGNLQELDLADRSGKSSPGNTGSAGDMKAAGHSERRLSPISLRRKLSEIIHRSPTPPGNKSLVVPKSRSPTKCESPTSKTKNISLKLTVPSNGNGERKGSNVVAPWEDCEGDKENHIENTAATCEGTA